MTAFDVQPKRIMLILMFSLFTGFALGTAHASNFNVLDDSPSATVVEVEIDGWSRLDRPDGTLWLPAAAGVDERTGTRITPFLQRMIALPGDVRPRIIIEEQRWGEVREGVPPMGHLPEDDLPVPPLYGNGPIVISDPFEWRHRQVAHVFVVPIEPVGKGVRTLDYIRFRIEYPRAAERLVTRPDKLVEDGLLNGGTARSWAKPRAVSAERRTASANALWPDGPMVRIEIEETGIYQIAPADLEARGVDPSGFDPRKFRLFNNGGQPLPLSIATERPDSLIENAIIVTGSGDGSFDPEDRIIFYGRSVNTWVRTGVPGGFEHTMNPYTWRNVYWLNLSQGGPNGKRMQSFESEAAAGFDATTARSRVFVDDERVIFNNTSHPQSGTRWFATELLGGEQYSTSFSLQSPLPEADGKLRISIRYLGSNTATAAILINGSELGTYQLSEFNQVFDIPPDVLVSGSNTFTFRLNSGHVYFDWVELNYLRELTASGGRMEFDALNQGGIARVNLEGLTQPWVFDVSDFANVMMTRNVPYIAESNTSQPRRILAISDDQLRSPVSMQPAGHGSEGYSNGLRDPSLSADYLLIYHPDFEQATDQLESYIEQRDGIEVLKVNVNDIYQDFSWGLFDVVAIRDFLWYTYHNWATTPETVLLAGDGDYDYRNISSDADANWIPPYENGSVSRDDWYAQFEEGQPQIVMGRLPVQTNNELEIYLQKMQRYENDADLGPWRSRIVMVADDEYVDSGPSSWDDIHMRQAEDFSREAAPDFLSIKKIYVGEYPTAFDPVTGGRRKPGATRDLLNEINQGALMVSFIGHGNAHVWTHESVLLDSRDNQLIDSGDRTPLYLAATCSWGHYDRPQNQSHPELLLAKSGGAIGVIAANRLTNALQNNRFALAFYERVFDREHDFSIGRALYLAKLDNPGGSNQYYHTLGEPNLMLALPRLDVELTGIEPDSLTALAEANVSGSVRTPSGQDLPDYNGESLVTVYDSADTLQYVFVNFNGQPHDTLDYLVPGGALFRGLVTTDGGDLNARFIVPRDVKYGSQNGSVLMYAYNDEQDGIGAASGVKISTTSASSDDNTPPDVNVYFNHPNWRDGDLTTNSPTLIVELEDESGINLTGDIGHDIRAVVDGTDEVLLTESFTYERDSYTRGTAEERLFELEPGQHMLEVWAWDNANNFQRSEVRFVVVDEDQDVTLQNVLNWPNPFSDRTNFTFELSADAQVTIEIFTASGRKIKEIGPVAGRAGFNYPEGTSLELEWDGRDRHGDPIANGAYLYVVKAKSDSGVEDEVVGKLLRIR